MTMRCFNNNYLTKKRYVFGFSLVELMVAITISLILIGGLIQIFISSKRSYLIQDSIGRMQENGRYVMDVLHSDLRLAGYLGGNADVTTVGGNLAPITPDGSCVGNDDDQWGRMIARGVFGINDGLANYNCISAAGNSPQLGEYLSGDILTVRYAKPVRVDNNGRIRNGTAGLYLKSSPMDGEIGLVTNTRSDIETFFDNAGLTDTPISYNKLETYSYYSGYQQSDCNGNSVDVPALYRIALDNDGEPTRQEIVRGVENLQVQYGIDTDNNGSINQFLDADNINDWTIVRTVRIWLLIRDECPSIGYTNTNNYVMGDSGLDLSGEGNSDNFRRHLYTSTVTLRNNQAI